ncbi:hypothetical protein WR25_19147 isoform B [Diploscapter pachys]|uniref:Uncharacterized protein n=1 Tax=Diploscapter pachys TaxID=2018661 RepID=A0A2A2JCY3_9BILA|nr:hypothetical protein WR25_19147 isoform B [Diploscapter pachys]
MKKAYSCHTLLNRREYETPISSTADRLIGACRRRLSRPILPGDVISWTEPDDLNADGDIIRFDREQRLYDRRTAGSYYCKIVGALEPGTDFFWSPTFKNIQFDTPSVLNSLSPDTMVYVWVNFTVASNLSVTVHFKEFDSIAEDDQFKIHDAPWQSEFACLPPPDDELDDEFGGLNVIYPKVIPGENYNKTKRDIKCETGWATSDRTIHCKDDTNQYIQTIRFHVPLALSFTKPDPGYPYEIRAFFDYRTSRYMVRNYFRNLKTPAKNKTQEGCVITTVNESEAYPGHYLCPTFGLISDPSGHVNIVPFTSLNAAGVKVGIEELMDGINLGNYNKFRITELVAEDKAKAYLWIRQNEIRLEDIQGVVISKNCIFCKNYPSIAFRRHISDKIEFPVGRIVTFSAFYAPEAKEFVVTRIKAEEEDDEVSTKCHLTFAHDFYRPGHYRKLYAFREKMSKGEEYSNIAESEHFGLINVDDKNGLTKKKTDQYLAWLLVEMVCSPGNFTNSRIAISVLSYGRDLPKVKIAISEMVRHQQEMEALTGKSNPYETDYAYGYVH